MHILSAQARSLWAKSDRGKEKGSWLPLWCHLLDVAACARQILLLEPRTTIDLFRADFGLDSNESALAWVSVLVGLHDLGKASPAFQQKNDEGRLRVFAAGLDWGNRKPEPPPKDLPHSVVSMSALDQILKQHFQWDRESAKYCGQSVGMHHGWPITNKDLIKSRGKEIGDQKWTQVREELFAALVNVIGVEPPRSVSNLTASAFQRLAGLTSFADWVGSSLSFGDPEQSLDQYWHEANRRASDQLALLGWRQRTPFASERRALAETFRYVHPEFSPRPLQEALERLSQDCYRPTLFLIEAPMGEGKTEAGFYASVELQRQLGHRGLYVALPTKATGNAMFSRTLDFLRSLNRELPIDVHLLHGATLLNQEYQELLTYRPNLDDESGREDSVTAAHYFSNRKRALLSEAGVGTIDQALIGILPVKHQFVRLWGLGNRVVLVDEVHAYDTYTGDLLKRLLEWLYALGSSVILMSATLPDRSRRALLQTWQPAQQEAPIVYPRITRITDGHTTQLTFPCRPQATIMIESHPDDLEQVGQSLLAATEGGGCACCIVNTVDRAQRLFQLVRDQADHVYLFHARYPLQQRQHLEDQVLKLFGSDASCRPTRAVLVATQVVEQSLDLDFDLMFSDLAPIDLILQRAGRLHRHRNNDGRRQGHNLPLLKIIGLTGAERLPDFSTNYWDKVYAPYVLLRTWLSLQELKEVDLQKDIDPLVQTVYGDQPTDLPSFVVAELDSARQRLEQQRTAHEDQAHFSSIGSPRDCSWQTALGTRCSDAEEGVEPGTQRVSTRIGDPSLVLIPIVARDGQHFLYPDGQCVIPQGAKLKPDLARKMFLQSLSTSRQSVVHYLKNNLPWQGTPLLRGLAPLYLDESGERMIGKTQIIMDRELGLVYRSANGNQGGH